MPSPFISQINKEDVRRGVLILLPLLVLLGDLLWFPLIFESRQLVNNIGIISLLKEQTIWLGTLRAHNIYISIDSIHNSKYLSYVEGPSDALAISHFVAGGASGSSVGALGQAVLEKLALVSPDDNRRLYNLLSHTDKGYAGEVLELALNIPREHYRRFPINHLFILLFEQGPSGGNKDVISKGIIEILDMADKENILTLIIPCLAYNWEDKNSLSFIDFFQPLFDSLSDTNGPRNIYLSLYTDWPTFTLEEAVTALNRAWENHSRGFSGHVPVLYRNDFRLTLLSLSLCLLVSSFFVPLAAKNYLIIVSSFTGSAVGAGKIIDFVTQGHSSTFHFFIQVSILAVLAVGFPFFVDWNPKNLFSKDRS